MLSLVRRTTASKALTMYCFGGNELTKYPLRLTSALTPVLLLLAGVAHAQSTTNTITLNPSTLTFNTGLGTPATAQPVTVLSSGGNVAFTTSVSPAVSWLTVTPPAGTTPQALSISANP